MPIVDWELLLEFVEDRFTKIILLNLKTGGFTVLSSFRPEEEEYVNVEHIVGIQGIPETLILEEMERFIESLEDEKVRKRLSSALQRKNPIRQVRRVLGFYPELLEEWNRVRKALLAKWVLKELNQYEEVHLLDNLEELKKFTGEGL